MVPKGVLILNKIIPNEQIFTMVIMHRIAVHFLIAYIFKDNLLNLSANSASNHD